MTELNNCHNIYSASWVGFAACPAYHAAVDGMHLFQLMGNSDSVLGEQCKCSSRHILSMHGINAKRLKRENEANKEKTGSYVEQLYGWHVRARMGTK